MTTKIRETAEAREIRLSDAAVAHRTKCHEAFWTAMLKLSGGRAHKAVDMAALKDETGLTKTDFIDALTAEWDAGHVYLSERHGTAYRLEINGVEADTVHINL